MYGALLTCSLQITHRTYHWILNYVYLSRFDTRKKGACYLGGLLQMGLFNYVNSLHGLFLLVTAAVLTADREGSPHSVQIWWIFLKWRTRINCTKHHYRHWLSATFHSYICILICNFISKCVFSHRASTDTSIIHTLSFDFCMFPTLQRNQTELMQPCLKI